MVYRVYVEKKAPFAQEAAALFRDIRSFLQIEQLEGVRILNRYDVENIDRALFEASIRTIFSEPQLDDVYFTLPGFEGAVFATEYLPGQFDQRADSAAQCVQLAFQSERPTVRTARVYMLKGALTHAQIESVKKYVINPVESRQASLEEADTLAIPTELPTTVPTMTGFIRLDEKGLADFIERYALAMDLDDIKFCQRYFADEKRDPTLTEIRMIDTYWSDHCRHTTFSTHIVDAQFDDPAVEAAYRRYMDVRAQLGVKKPVTLMDIATIGGKYLKATGKLNDLDESEEINACTVKVDVDVDGQIEKWLLLFKNETHNHPTEIEPFGGAATCIGGAIRDPLSGRAYVYQAMRVTGAADPLRPVSQTIPGKLPQRKLVTTAAAGYSSYGNQIGLATGIVDEIYHEGYAAKRMEIGAVVGAAPAANVRREEPAPGDVILLLGGRTGRDGCGGATGSSKSHNLKSLEKCGAEVQKGNAPEERKLQRLFRNPEAARLIKRCNDFGAGGVSVAIGELADGLLIDLDAVPKKYDGLDGTELAISESQERMAVALDPSDVERFIAIAQSENLEATRVAVVKQEKRLIMNWKGHEIVNISRAFLNSNGASKSARARVAAPQAAPIGQSGQGDFGERMKNISCGLNTCSRRGLAERFDSTIGANTVLMPFGGRRQLTPAQAMVARLPVGVGVTHTCSAMAYGFDPFISERSPYRGAYLAVVESLARLVACGAGIEDAHLTLQEYFPRTRGVPERWGLPMGALLGALSAQLDLGIAAIGGKDSMSGSFEDLDVPPTLVSFAVSTCKIERVISPEFKRTGSPVRFVRPVVNENGLPDAQDLMDLFKQVTRLIGEGKVRAAWALGMGGAAEGLMKMCMGNAIGFELDGSFEDMDALFTPCAGAFLLEMAGDTQVGALLGKTTERYAIAGFGQTLDMLELEENYEGKLESVFACNIPSDELDPPQVSNPSPAKLRPAVKVARPRVLIPAFPGTNCEYDTARAFERAGAQSQILVVNNLSAAQVARSAERFADALAQSQILFLPGGFSGGDEPDGSAKFITAFLRNPRIRERIDELLSVRDGLIGGICNGFQALIKLGLVPFGEIVDAEENAPTLTFNRIGRHQSRLVRTRVACNKSPWLSAFKVGDIHLTPVSHGEGRFVVSDELFSALCECGQIATQYVDEMGRPSMEISVNPNGSMYAVEGITSPDGRVFGRMAHSERCEDVLYKNVEGVKSNGMFAGAVDYFS